MDTLIAEPVDAPNPAIAPLFQIGRHRRGVGDPCRSAALARPLARRDVEVAAGFLNR